MAFLHGVEVIELDGGSRPISGVASSVIGLVGTAPTGTLNEPVLIAGSRTEAVAQFGAPDGVHSIPDALDAIFDQAGAMVVVVNVLDTSDSTHISSVAAVDYTLGSDDTLSLDNTYSFNLLVVSKDATPVTYVEDTDYSFDATSGVITRLDTGGIDAEETLSISYDISNPSGVTVGNIQGEVDGTTGAYSGIQALLGAESALGVTPRLLIAPGYSDDATIVSDLISVADRLRAIAIADGPNGTDANAITYRGNFGSGRLYLVDPHVKVYDSSSDAEITQVSSARVAGVIAKSDNERGFWFSPSNRPILGITGTARPIDFALGDSSARANYLNENAVATIIRQDGYRLWGNRSCSADSKWAFISVRRTADLINDALLRAHMWAVDRNITTTYVDSVVEGVSNYLRHLKSIGAIINGACWADPELNTADQIALGNVYFDFDFTPPYPAEHITFRSRLVNDYLEEIFA